VRLAVARAYLQFEAGGGFRERPPARLSDVVQRRFYTQLLYAMVRHRRLLEAELSRLSTRPLERIEPELRTLALLGLAQLRILSGVPPHAAVNETVALAVPLGRARGTGWVNGVLRNAQRQPLDADTLPLAVRTSHPDWMVARWQSRYGEAATAALCAANNHHGGVTLRVAQQRISPAALAERLAAEDIAATPHPLWPAALEVARAGGVLASSAFAEGLCYIQDVSSQLLLAWVAPRLTGPLLDACAAPGGKLTHLLGLAEALPPVVAVDNQWAGLGRVRENCTRLGCQPVGLVQADGARLPLGDACMQSILLDVPCSSTGTIRKYPELKWRKHANDLPRYAARQRGLLDDAARVLRTGGHVLYATCSLEPEENEQQVEAFLARQPAFRRVPLGSLPAPQGLTAAPETLLNAEGDLLLLPTEHQMGLYGALLVKTASRETVLHQADA
jgi:16S rRNA (cytosine967-C5)-methyltransferase